LQKGLGLALVVGVVDVACYLEDVLELVWGAHGLLGLEIYVVF